MEYALEIRNLSKRYRDFSLKDVSFALPKGYIMGLIGPNGAGKTTIIRLIMNLAVRSAGEIKVFGMDHRRDEARVKERIGFVYDVPSFYLDASLKTIARSIAPFYSSWNHALFSSLTERFELPMKKKFKKLSQGMKTKFALAMALSHDADLILLDEPTSGLDPVFRRELLEILSGVIQQENKSILFSTHITSDLEKIADYITFIQEGEVVFTLEKEVLFENWKILRGGKELLECSTDSAVRGVKSNEYGVELLVSDIGKISNRYRENALVERATLEEIMLHQVREVRHVS